MFPQRDVAILAPTGLHNLKYAQLLYLLCV